MTAKKLVLKEKQKQLRITAKNSQTNPATKILFGMVSIQTVNKLSIHFKLTSQT